MKAVFILGSMELDALKKQPPAPLTFRTQNLLKKIGEDNNLDITVIITMQDKLHAGQNKQRIGLEKIREERPRVLSEIHQASPDFIMCFGPVASAAVFDKGNMKEDDLIRRAHYPLGEDRPPVYVTYSLENVRRSPGLIQWLELDTKAAIEGHTETIWGDYTILQPDEWYKWSTPHFYRGPFTVIYEEGHRVWFDEDHHRFKTVALDLETYPGLDRYHPNARIRMVSLSVAPGKAYVVQAGPNSELPEWLTQLMACSDILKVGSNIKFDVKWLQRFDYAITNYEDISTREHIIDSSNPKTDLKSLTFKYLPRLADYSATHRKMVKERKGWENIRDNEQYDYAAADAEATIAVWRGQVEVLHKLGGGWPRDLFRQLYPVVANIEHNGFRVDSEESTRLDKEYVEILGKMRTELVKDLGPVNLNSPIQLARALQKTVPNIDLTVKDWKSLVSNEEEQEISTVREILEREAHKHPIIKNVLRYRKYRTRHSTFIKSVREKHMVEHHGGKYLHTGYRTDNVETYRLSSQNPPMMNIPSTDYEDPTLSIKRQFVSRFCDGKIIEADLAQIELRYAAWVSQDIAMIDAITSGRDIHTWMAGKLLGKDPTDVTEQERYECKTRTFLILYGGGANRLIQALLESDVESRRISKKEASKMIAEYFRTFHGLKQFIDTIREQVKQDLYVETEFGFRRQFIAPDHWNSSEGWSIQRQAFNARVQSPAACLTYCAMIWLHNAVLNRNMQSKMVAQVHDSIVYDVPPHEVKEMEELLKYGMEVASIKEAKKYNVNFTVPLVADIKVGDSWGTVKEVKQ